MDKAPWDKIHKLTGKPIKEVPERLRAIGIDPEGKECGEIVTLLLERVAPRAGLADIDEGALEAAIKSAVRDLIPFGPVTVDIHDVRVAMTNAIRAYRAALPAPPECFCMQVGDVPLDVGEAALPAPQEPAVDAVARALWQREADRSRTATRVMSEAAGKPLADDMEPFEENADIWRGDAKAAIAAYEAAKPRAGLADIDERAAGAARHALHRESGILITPAAMKVVISAYLAAMPAPQSEPVAWRCRWIFPAGKSSWELSLERPSQNYLDTSGLEEEPLYAAPQSERAAVIEECARVAETHYTNKDRPDWTRDPYINTLQIAAAIRALANGGGDADNR